MHMHARFYFQLSPPNLQRIMGFENQGKITRIMALQGRSRQLYDLLDFTLI